MTNKFFLNNSSIYSDAHKISLFILLTSTILRFNYLSVVWVGFCFFGFFLYLKKENKLIFSINGLVGCIPFIFSLISSVWFVAGVNDLQLLGYNRTWSFYAALHGSFLGWILIGCLAFLSRRANSSKFNLWGCFFCFTFFLLVAFGIDGLPYAKRIGVVGFSLVVPFLLAHYAFNVKNQNKTSFYWATLSLFSIAVTMTLAVLNEFWAATPRIAFGIPIMVLVHGFMNALLTVPCFFLAISIEFDESKKNKTMKESIVFFDGFCALCSRTVSLLIKMDKKRVLKYSSLQGEYVREILDLPCTEVGTSVVFYHEETSYQKAAAVVQILKKLGGIYKYMGIVLNIFPSFLLNRLYDFIAQNRYRFLGENPTCFIPDEKNKNLFIP